jgi:hypothetical protein
MYECVHVCIGGGGGREGAYMILILQGTPGETHETEGVRVR